MLHFLELTFKKWTLLESTIVKFFHPCLSWSYKNPHLTWTDWAHLIDLPAKITADTQRSSEEYYPTRFIPHCCLLLPRNCPGLVSISSSHHSLLRHIPGPARSPPGSRAGCYSFGSPSTQDGQRPE